MRDICSEVRAGVSLRRMFERGKVCGEERGEERGAGDLPGPGPRRE